MKPVSAAAPNLGAASAQDDSDDEEGDDEEMPENPSPSPSPKVQASVDEEDEDEDGGTPNSREVKANIAFTSDYLERGLTLTEHKPALQGGLDWAHPSGFFAAIWASNVSVPDLKATLAFDGSVGYGLDLGRGFEEALSVHYLTYFEGATRANWSFESETKWRDLTATFNYSPSYRQNGYSWTATLGWARSVKWEIKLGAAVDYTVYEYKGINTTAVITSVDAEGEEFDKQVVVAEPTPNYGDLRLSVGHEFLGALWQVEGVLVRKQTIEGILAQPRAAASVSKEF